MWTTAGHYTIDHRPQLTRQWNKCVKQCLEWDSLLPFTYSTVDSGLAYTYLTHCSRCVKEVCDKIRSGFKISCWEVASNLLIFIDRKVNFYNISGIRPNTCYLYLVKKPLVAVEATAHAYRKCTKTAMVIVRLVHDCGTLRHRAPRWQPPVVWSRSTAVESVVVTPRRGDLGSDWWRTSLSASTLPSTLTPSSTVRPPRPTDCTPC